MLNKVYAFALDFDTPFQWADFSIALDAVLSLYGEHILRLKGLLNIEGENTPRVIQCVHHVRYSSVRLSSWPPKWSDRNSQLVFIVRDLARETVARVFRMCRGAASVMEAVRDPGPTR